jgi:hypothetical protein
MASGRIRWLLVCAWVGLAVSPRSAAAAEALNAFGLPLRFEPNKGQMDERVRFLARGHGFGLHLTREGATLSLHRAATRASVSMRLVGGRRDVEPVGAEPQAGVTNYFVGSDPARWRTGVEGYARVRYPAVLPGVDLVYYGTGQRRLEYDVVLAPGADPERVALAFEGATSITLAADGAAVLHVAGGTIAQAAPVAYQVGADGKRSPVGVRYRRRGAGLGFVVGPYDHGRTLVIDPTLAYSTYLGSTGGDGANCIAVDAAGEAFFAGSTDASGFPTVTPLQASYGGVLDAFVTKLNAAGTALVYSTYLGGSSSDGVNGIAVDSAGNAYVTGTTSSTNFPVVGAFQPANAGSEDAFVAKLGTTGSTLVYSSYLGGGQLEDARAIALDGSRNAYVTGSTNSTNFPTTAPFQAVGKGGFEVFVTKINAAGSARVYSTYLGGSQDDFPEGVAVDSAGEAFITGSTQSINTPGCSGCANFPTASPFQAAGSGFGTADAFVTKLAASGSALVYSTYLGGSANDHGMAIALDSAGEAFVTGYTSSSNFPLASPLQAALGGATATNSFVTKLNAAGSALVYSTYLGGKQIEEAAAIAVDSSGQAFVTGWTGSTDFPTVAPLQATLTGLENSYVSKINAAGTALVYSTFLGGSGQDLPGGIAVDPSGAAYVAGSTTSPNFPTAAPIQASLKGSTDAYVVKLTTPAPPPPAVPASSGPTTAAAALLLLVLGTALGLRRHAR